jgi:hypothetical protein
MTFLRQGRRLCDGQPHSVAGEEHQHSCGCGWVPFVSGRLAPPGPLEVTEAGYWHFSA